MSSGSYTILPHTADIRLHVSSEHLEGLFETALRGMMDIINSGTCDEASQFSLQSEIHLSAPDPTVLMIDFLSEILTLSHIHSALYCRIQWQEISSIAIKAVVYGLPLQVFQEDIKAVTYHEADVKKTGDRWETTIIFDI